MRAGFSLSWEFLFIAPVAGERAEIIPKELQ